MSNRSKLREVFHFVGRAGGLVGLAGVVLVAGACKGKKDVAAPKGGDTSASVPKVDPTLCETAGKNVVTYDLNRDNQPDVWRLYKTEEEGGTKIEFMTCKQVDFDHDGRKDWVVGFNRKGTRLFEKVDMDYDDKFDLSAIFDPKTGLIAEVERDRDFDGKYDLKEIYDSSGQLQSVRHDKDADGEPDQWEQYKDGVLITILFDDNFDGKVDRREEVPGARPKIQMPDTGVAPVEPTEGEGAGSGSAAPAPGAGK
ncbi:MAG: hypothetical protein KBG28_13245 [Kofleriaceae bacterium]|jgi:hypothetical protein|nr:hypothetical protein [Kofleriaceae bacterium]MBP6839715.1 hypothetical protein [Kofleriaceae bacterium]MBP9204930.1 hypothetical protein [Kofleriaceae bacterium]